MLLCALLGVGLVQHAFGFYNPSEGKWLNRDPIEEHGGVNLYAFVNNGPISNLDPLGLAQYDFIRNCNPTERNDCAIKCRPNGIKSCTVKETYESSPGSPPKLISTLIICWCDCFRGMK